MEETKSWQPRTTFANFYDLYAVNDECIGLPFIPSQQTRFESTTGKPTSQHRSLVFSTADMAAMAPTDCSICILGNNANLWSSFHFSGFAIKSCSSCQS